MKVFAHRGSMVLTGLPRTTGLVPLERRGEVLARDVSSRGVGADATSPRVLSQAVVSERAARLVQAMRAPLLTQE